MTNFEKQTNSAEVATEHDLREYFESYVSDAESQENEQIRAGYIDLDKIKGILSDVDAGSYESALAYVEGEIDRMREVQEGMDEFDRESGKPYVEKINSLKTYLASKQVSKLIYNPRNKKEPKGSFLFTD